MRPADRRPATGSTPAVCHLGLQRGGEAPTSGRAVRGLPTPNPLPGTATVPTYIGHVVRTASVPCSHPAIGRREWRRQRGHTALAAGRFYMEMSELLEAPVDVVEAAA